jgi:hypothetical protein
MLQVKQNTMDTAFAGDPCGVAVENKCTKNLKLDPSQCGEILGIDTMNGFDDDLPADLNEYQKYDDSIDCVESTCSGVSTCETIASVAKNCNYATGRSVTNIIGTCSFVVRYTGEPVQIVEIFASSEHETLNNNIKNEVLVVKSQTDSTSMIRYLSYGLQLMGIFVVITMIFQYQSVFGLMHYYFFKPKRKRYRRQGKDLPPERRKFIRFPGDGTGCTGKASLLFFKCKWLFVSLLVAFNPVMCQSLISSTNGDVENLNGDENEIFTGGMESVERRRLGEQKSKYGVRTSGYCTDVAGASSIGTEEDCEKGAGYGGWSDRTAYKKSWSDRPPGCYRKADSTSYLCFNTYSSWYPTSCSSTYMCVCKLTCQAGTYQDQNGQTTCKSCAAGQYNYQNGRSSCQSCATGQYSTLGKTSCEYDACPKGTYASGTAACTSCAAGKYNDATGQTTCKSCAAGQYNYQNGRSSCQLCAIGKYNDLIGQNSRWDCKTCESGKEPTDDQKRCVIIGEQPSKYVERTSGLCTDVAGGSYIGTEGDCEEGAGVLGWSDTTASTESTSSYPPGCYFWSTGSSLYFNTKTSSTTPCSSSKKCLCKLTCQAGTYQDQTGQASCKTCAPGLYNNQNGRSSCQLCATGQYSSLGKPSCDYEASTCPKGTYASGTAACTSCAAGKYNDAIGQTTKNVCKSCEAGRYNDVFIGQEDCKNCAPLHYTDEIEQTECKSCNTGEESTGDYKACVLIGEQPVVYAERTSGLCTDIAGGSNIGTKEDCEEGAVVLGWSDTTAFTGSWSHYPPGCFSQFSIISYKIRYTLRFNTNTTATTQCSSSRKCLCKLTCQAGTYQDQTEQTTCKTCDTGQYQNENERLSCKNDCNSGSYINSDKTACTKCAKGFYQDEDQTPTCKNCTKGRYNDQTERKSESGCKQCGTGRYSDQINLISESNCKICAEGKYNDQKGRNTTCEKCPTGTKQPEEGKSYCDKCIPGKYQSDSPPTKCDDCLANTYTNQATRSECKVCDDLTRSDAGSTFCSKCEEGQYLSNTTRTCATCPAGYASIYGQLECSECGLGKYADKAINATSCVSCRAGKYGKPNPNLPLFPRILEKEACTNCSEAKYSSATGAATESECNACPPGKYSTGEGKTSTKDCKLCAPNTYQNNEGMTSCKPCDDIRNENSKEGSTFCGKCDEGQYMSTDRICLGCPRGYASIYGQDVCSECVAGQYAFGFASSNDPIKATSCKFCQIGKVGTSISVAQRIDETVSCIFCGEGRYQNQEGQIGCTSCAPGSFSTEEGKTSTKDCKLCAPNTYQNDEGMTSCKPCDDIRTENSKEGSTFCEKCDKGQYMSTNRICLGCPRGYASIYGQDVCSECVAGQYAFGFASSNDPIKATSCKLCQAGRYGTNISTSQRINKDDACDLCDAGRYSSAKGASSPNECNKCAAGKKNPTEGSTSSSACTECATKMYQDEASQSSCKTCAQGRGPQTEGSTSCTSCLPGKFEQVVDKEKICSDCPIGWFTNISDLSSCFPCGTGDKGETTPVVGSSSCTRCEAGKRQTAPGNCLDCPIGQYQDGKGEKSCKSCDVDKYSTERGRSSGTDCIDCPFDKSTGVEKGSTAKTSCRCKRIDYYSNGTSCEKCPIGADCSTKDGLALAELTAKPGYWRPDLTTDTFSPCVVGFSSLDAQELADARCCPVNITTNTSICSNTTFKHTNAQCKKEYAGTLCLVCAAGYVKQGTTCIECEGGASIGTAALPLIVLLLVFFCILMIFLICGKKAEETAENGNKWFGQVKIILSFLQIFSSMPGVLDGVPWPKTFIQFSLPLNIFNMDFLAVLAKSGCSLNVRFYDKFILHMILPVGCLLVIVLAYFIAKTFCAKRTDTQKQTNMKETASKAVILVILLIFPGLATKIFTIFKCKTIEGIPGSLLVEDYDQRCYEGEHFTFMIVGGIFLCLYVLGIPLIMFLLLWRNKKHLHDEKSPKHHIIKNALGGMYTQYEPSYWWFEIFLLMNKTMMCGGLVMAAPGTPLQVLIATLIMLSHLLVVLKLAPYKSTGEDSSSFLSSLTLTLTTIGGIVLMTDGNSDGSEKKFNSEALAYILITISVSCIASQIGITIFVDCGVWERIRGKKKKNDKKVDNSKTKVQPIEDNKSGSDEKMNNNEDDILSKDEANSFQSWE